MTEQMSEFSHKVSAFGGRLDEWRRAACAPTADPLMQCALAELEAAHEELRVADEELRVQREQIREAQASLDEARWWSDKLVDRLAVPLLETNATGGVSYANPTAAELLGLPRDTLVGKPLAAYVAVEDRPAFRAALSMLAHGGDKRLLSLHLRRRRGAPVPVILTGAKCSRLIGSDALHWVAIPVAGEDTQVGDAANHLLDSLVNLSLLPLADRSTRKLLRHLVVLAVRALPEVDAAVIALGTDQGQLRAAEPASAAHLADMEQTLHEGPATTASAGRRIQRSGNLASDGQWREFGVRASSLGMQSVLAIPVAPGENTQGVLMLLSQRRDAFTDDATRRCVIFAEAAAAAAAVALERELSSRTADQMLQALHSRETIEQAKGIIMAQRQCSPEEAFQLLVEVSQRTNMKLRIVAERLVDAIKEPER
jgi:PAS domain-containing protein